jgi:hypothetical protein
MSRAAQSLRVYASKLINGWPLVIRAIGPLFRRFVFERFGAARGHRH